MKFIGTQDEFLTKFGGKVGKEVPMLSTAQMNSCSILLENDGLVHIDANVTLFDSGKQKTDYIWRVRTLAKWAETPRAYYYCNGSTQANPSMFLLSREGTTVSSPG